VPFNIASYALAHPSSSRGQAGLAGSAGEFIWTGGDCHLYTNHLDQAREQLTRQPRDRYRRLEILFVTPPVDRRSTNTKTSSCTITSAQPHIKAAVSV
jgi:thymidylate synthase